MTRAKENGVAARPGRKWALIMTCSHYQYRILLLLTALVLGWISLQLRNYGTTFDATPINKEIEGSSPPTVKKSGTAIPLLLLPPLPDTSIEEGLKHVIPDEIESPLKHCKPTSQVQIILHTTVGKWILQSLDQGGNFKNVGGDEFYITFRASSSSSRDDNSRGDAYPSGVANILDRQDGTYELDFIAPPLVVSSENQVKEHLTGAGGNITIHCQYTCGIGFMAPPSKDDWLHGGALQKSFTVFTPHSPPIQPFQPSPSLEAAGILAKYEQVLVFGDSAMKQFVKNASRAFEPNIVYRVKRRKPWAMTLIEEHLQILIKQLGRDLDATATGSPHSIALILGSSIWDVLASKKEHTANATPNHSESVFQDHLKACRHFISTVRKEYPNVDILWKSPTAMHIHVVDPSAPILPSGAAEGNDDNGSSTLALLQRVRYMSSSRMSYLYQLQKELMQELQVTFLDIYEATYLSASWTFPGDGRHYSPELHQHILRWFY